MHCLFTLENCEVVVFSFFFSEIRRQIKLIIVFLQLLFQLLVNFGSLHFLDSFLLGELRFAILGLALNFIVVVTGSGLPVIVATSSLIVPTTTTAIVMVLATWALLKPWLFVATISLLIIAVILTFGLIGRRDLSIRVAPTLGLFFVIHEGRLHMFLVLHLTATLRALLLWGIATPRVRVIVVVPT